MITNLISKEKKNALETAYVDSGYLYRAIMTRSNVGFVDDQLFECRDYPPILSRTFLYTTDYASLSLWYGQC
jgi:hypothetical protein